MLERVVHASGLVGYRSPRLAAVGVPHLFTTRIGPGGGELCLAEPDGRAVDAVRALAGVATGAPIAYLRQVHGATVVDADGVDLGACSQLIGEGDALVSRRPGRLAMVYTADCVPVLIASGDGRRVAAVHAGWRGLVAGVLPAAIAALLPDPRDRTGAAAAVGACLSPARCEMGPEVVERFEAAGLSEAVQVPAPDDPPLAPGRALVDVRRAAVRQLRDAGIAAVDVSDRCTWGEVTELHSHRRDVTHGGLGRSGRLGALIGPRA